MKRCVLIKLVCLFVLCLLVAQAQEEFIVDAETGMLTAYHGQTAKVEIPAVINGIPLRAIDKNVFGHNKSIKEVVIPEGVTHIMDSAFYACDELESVTLSSSIQSVDGFAFFLCQKLERIVLPANLVFIGSNAFSACDSLKDVTFLGDVPFLGKEVFEIGPEERVYTVPESAMADYEQLLGSRVTAGERGQLSYTEPVFDFDSESGLITGYEGYSAKLTIPGTMNGQKVTGIKDRAFFAHKWARVLTLEEGIREIGHSAFFAVPLAVVRLPGTLERIGEQAFLGSLIEEINFPNSLREIGKGAFQSAKFTEITLPEGMSSIEDSVFEACWNLEDVYLPSTLSKIGSRAFFGCSVLNYIVFEGDSPPSIAKDAFLDCPKINDIDLPWNASKVQAQAFTDAFVQAGIPQEQFKVWRANNPAAPPFLRKTTMQFDEETQLVISSADQVEALHMYYNFWKKDASGLLPVKGIAEGIFEGSSLKEFFVPHNDQFVLIGKRAFANSALERIDLFDSVEVIEEEAFAGCTHLTQISIPDSVQRIGDRAFAGCTSLQRIVFEGESILLGSQLFEGCDALGSVVLPAGTQVVSSLGIKPELIRVADTANDEQIAALHSALGMEIYEDLLRESEVKAHTPMPDSFVPNAKGEFDFNAETGTINRYIGASETVVIPSQIDGVTVREIAFNAFSNLTVFSVLEGTQDNISLKHIVIPETVQVIGDSAFLSCKRLERVDCYGSIHYLGVRAFEECSALSEVLFYNNIYEMGGYTFNLCERL
ncbi:MAG: leucine-rich repeat domain-containing protein, partial [Clostridiales bacterium]|nr:leucine-rich repeat domain-containing protein [Clostridiales bacterium]